MQKTQRAQRKSFSRIVDSTLKPDVHFVQCPIKASMGVFGRKWTMLMLRDIGFRKIDRFNQLLDSIPGLTPRVLSMRLKELEKDGIITKVEDPNQAGITKWGLTEKGRDALPILMRLIAFGSKWYARDVFEDKSPRALNEIFTKPEAQEIVQRLYQA